MNLEVMRDAASQLGAAPPEADTPYHWSEAIRKALGARDGFGLVACSACGRDTAPDLAFCAYCGHHFDAVELAAAEEPPAAAPEPPPAKKGARRRRELVRAALAAGVRPSQFRGRTNSQLEALIKGRKTKR